MGFCSSVGQALVLARRVISVLTLLLLLVTLFTPFYHISANGNTYLYSELYVYTTADGLSVWEYTTDNIGLLIVLGISWVFTAVACVVLTITSLCSNRGRNMAIISFACTLLGLVSFLFIPFSFQAAGTCSFPPDITDDTKNPCNNILGSEGESSFGPYYGWFLLGIGCIGCLASLVIALIAPSPKAEEDDYISITNSSY